MRGMWLSYWHHELDVPPNLEFYCNRYNMMYLDFHDVVDHMLSGGIRIIR